MFGFSVCFISILISAIFFCWNCIHILNHLIVIYLIAKLFCLSAVMVVVSDMCVHICQKMFLPLVLTIVCSFCVEITILHDVNISQIK